MPEEKIPPEPTPEPQPVVEPVSEQKISEIPPKPANSRLKVILLAVLGLVIVGGLICVGYKLGQKQTKPGPTPTPVAVATPTPTPDSTASWKTYTNTKVGFSFKYPQTLTISECKDGLHLFESISGFMASEFCETPPLGKISLEYSNTPLSPGYSQSIDFEVKEEEITLGSTKAIKQTVKKIKEAPGPDYTVLVTFSNSKDTYYFLVSLRDEQDEDTFDLMLSTFKFLEEENQETSEEEIFCDEPRPEVCTMECISPPPYICGSNGKLYCNKCAACADWKVDWYIIQNEPCGI